MINNIIDSGEQYPILIVLCISLIIHSRTLRYSLVHKCFSSIHKVLWKIPNTTYYLCFLMQKLNHRALEAKAGRVEIKNNLPIVREFGDSWQSEDLVPQTLKQNHRRSPFHCVSMLIKLWGCSIWHLKNPSYLCIARYL